MPMIIDGVCRGCGNRVDSMLRHCLQCHQDLDSAEFGVNSIYRDGRQPYCKSCICATVQKARANRREREAVRKALRERRAAEIQQRIADRSNEQEAVSHADRVREAIAGGAQTAKEITRDTFLSDEQVETALCQLQLVTREISTVARDNKRLYFLKDGTAAVSNGRRPGCSLIQLAHAVGPVSHGVSVRRRCRAENREHPEGLEPPAGSRVA